MIDRHGIPLRQIIRSSDPDRIRDRIFYDLGIIHGSSMMRRTIYDTIGGYRSEYPHVEDVDWIFRAIYSGFRASNIPDIVLKYRKRKNSTERHFRKKAILSYYLKKEIVAQYGLRLSLKEQLSLYAHLILGWSLPPRFRDVLFHIIRRWV